MSDESPIYSGIGWNFASHGAVSPSLVSPVGSGRVPASAQGAVQFECRVLIRLVAISIPRCRGS